MAMKKWSDIRDRHVESVAHSSDMLEASEAVDGDTHGTDPADRMVRGQTGEGRAASHPSDNGWSTVDLPRRAPRDSARSSEATACQPSPLPSWS